MAKYNESYLAGYKQAIEDLRRLQEMWNHKKHWCISYDLKYAPVELSDYLVIRGYRTLQQMKVLQESCSTKVTK